MVIAYGELKPGTYVASGDGATVSMHVGNPLPGHVTVALTDKDDAHSVVILPQAHFDGAIQAYLDRSTHE